VFALLLYIGFSYHSGFFVISRLREIMNKKKRCVFLVLVFSVVLSSGILLKQDTGQEKQETKKKFSESNSGEQNKKTDSEDKIEDIRGRAPLPFKNYKDIYQDWEPTALVEFDEDDVCQKKGANFGYTYVEFVFLERLEDNTLRPYTISSIKYQDLGFDRSCPGASKNYHGTMRKFASCRIRFAVVRDCNKCAGVLEPGETYRFYEYEGLGDVDYRFEIPEADRLNFVSPNSDDEPNVFRYPVLVDDIRETRNGGGQFRQKVTLTIRNAVSSLPASKIGNVSNVLVKYEGKNFTEKTEGVENDGIYKFKLNLPKRRKIYGGDVKVFSLIKKSTFVPEVYEKKANLIGMQMLMYKQQIETKQIDLSEGLDYHHQPKNTVVKEISLESYIENNETKISKLPAEVELKKVFWEQKKSVVICKTISYRKEGNWYARIEALPGEYALLIGRNLVQKRLEWPPDSGD